MQETGPVKHPQYPDFVIDHAICDSIGSSDHLPHATTLILRDDSSGQWEGREPLNCGDDAQSHLRSSFGAVPGDEIMG